MVDSSNKIKVFFQKNKSIIITSFILLFILLVIFFLKPAITGYSVYSDILESNQNISEYSGSIKDIEQNLLVLNTDLNSCEDLNNELIAEYKNCSNENSKCSFALTKKIAESEKFSNTISDKNKEIDALKIELNNELTSLEDKYDKIIKEAARVICCIRKVDNSEITGYTIKDKKIECTEGGGSGISC